MRNILELAASDEPDAGDHLRQVFLWKHERDMTAAKALAGVGASLFIGLLVASSQTKINASKTQLIFDYGSATLLILLGVLRFSVGASLHQRYLASLHLLRTAQNIRSFLARYEEAK